MNEEETYAKAIIDKLNLISDSMIELSDNQKKMFDLLSERSKLVVTQEIGQIEKQFHEQDFKKVTVLNETPKSFLVIKDGWQMYLAFSVIKDLPEDHKGFVPGTVHDFELKEDKKWIAQKWEKYKAVKNR